MNYGKLLIDISSIIKMIAMIPQVYKLYRSPKDVLDLSPLFLFLRTFSFILFGLGLYLIKDDSVKILIYLSIYYICVYSGFLILYFKEKRKIKHNK